jgi:hypothetical protein
VTGFTWAVFPFGLAAAFPFVVFSAAETVKAWHRMIISRDAKILFFMGISLTVS